jgi:hypothetical protein
LAIVLGDIEVMTNILEMTDCEANQQAGLLQKNVKYTLLKCTDKCTKNTFIEFKEQGLKEKFAKLKSKTSRSLLDETLSSLVAGVKGLEVSYEVLQGHESQTPNQTNFTNPPLPRTEVPANPCDGPPLPSMETKRAAKCVLSGANCYKLQERFLLIQSGIQDERDELQDKIVETEQYCKKTENTLNIQIANDEKMLMEAQKGLAQATEKEADAAENARQANTKHASLDAELKKQMKICNDNYIGFEGELCALKKIRGELYKLQGGGHLGLIMRPTSFQDCEVSKWDYEECTKVCGGGMQKLSRSILVHEIDGAKCVPLTAERSCNNEPCPVDCTLAAWTGWSKCSADCGGGVEQRLREVEVAMKFDGKPCGETSETRACAPQACEKDCKLSEWSDWGACSKDCDGGTKKRSKYVKDEPEGAGDCADEWSVTRLEYKKCNMARCGTPEIGDCNTHEFDNAMYSCSTLPQCCEGYSGMGTEAQKIQCLPDSFVTDPKHKVTCAGKMYIKKCQEPLDIVLLIDGSGSLGEKGWKASIKASNNFVDSMTCKEETMADGKFVCDTQGNVNMAVILFSGPPTWSGVNKCIGKTQAKVDMAEDCKIKTVTHFTTDMNAVKIKINDLTWPQGSTLTSLALMTAKYELPYGRQDSKSVIVVFTDGRPLSYRKTWQASRVVRKTSRLVWVPVTEYAPLKFLKMCATRRWQENLVQVNSFEEFEEPSVTTQLIADICPDKDVYGYSHWR